MSDSTAPDPEVKAGEAVGSPPPDKTSETTSGDKEAPDLDTLQEANLQLRRGLTAKGEELKGVREDLDYVVAALRDNPELAGQDIVSYLKTGEVDSNGSLVDELEEIFSPFDPETKTALLKFANLVQKSTDARVTGSVRPIENRLGKVAATAQYSDGLKAGGMTANQIESKGFRDFAQDQEGDEVIRTLSKAPRTKAMVLAERFLASDTRASRRASNNAAAQSARDASLESGGSRGGAAGAASGTIELNVRTMRPKDIAEAREKNLKIVWTGR